VVGAEDVALCGIGKTGEVGEFDSDLEEGVPYITGNILWAVYQFIVFIVLLSVLRARMVNTYHRIFREADVQWKFFRASIWWKYLDHNSILPPPFTLIFIIHALVKKIQRLCSRKGEEVGGECVTEVSVDKRDFNKKYKKLLLTLIQSKGNIWKFDSKQIKSFKNLGRNSHRKESLIDTGGD